MDGRYKSHLVFNSKPGNDPTYSPYRAGWNGYYDGLTNPHPLGDHDAGLWELGWMDARRKGGAHGQATE
jgi:hypothetical protein